MLAERFKLPEERFVSHFRQTLVDKHLHRPQHDAAIGIVLRLSRGIASSRLRNCTTSGANASHTSNGIVSLHASISSASSRACLGP
jgi:predicted glycoside hydrolase/deacetylase ChbG (UPF0249 family)